MKRFRKRLAAILSASMAVGLVFPAYAAPAGTVKVTVENVPGGYLVVSYNQDGVRYYLPVEEQVEVPAGVELQVAPRTVSTDAYYSVLSDLKINGESVGEDTNYRFTPETDSTISADFIGFPAREEEEPEVVFATGDSQYETLELKQGDKLPLYVRGAENKLIPLDVDAELDYAYYMDADGEEHDLYMTGDSETAASAPASITAGKLNIEVPVEAGYYSFDFISEEGEDIWLNIIYGYGATIRLTQAEAEGRRYSTTIGEYYVLDGNVAFGEIANGDVRGVRVVNHTFAGFTDRRGNALDNAKAIRDMVKPAENQTVVNAYAVFKDYKVPEIQKPEIFSNEANWKQQDGKWYFFDNEGQKVTNALIADDEQNIYYVGDDGARVTNTILALSAEDLTPEGKRVQLAGAYKPENLLGVGHERSYYFDEEGVLAHGLIEYKEADGSVSMIYADRESGELKRDEVFKYEGRYYGFGSDGRALKNQLAEFKNKYTDEMELYYFQEDGAALVDSFKQLDTEDGVQVYYFRPNGWAMKSGRKEDPKTKLTYVFDENGKGSIEITAEELGYIASPSEAKNAARFAASSLERGINGTSVAQAEYDTQEKVESFFNKLVDFFTAPYEKAADDGAGNFLEISAISTGSTPEYKAPQAGTSDNQAGTDGELKQDIYLQQDVDGKVYVATASVALKITATPYAEAEKPETPDPEKPEKPDPEKPEKPGTGGSGSIGGSGGGSSSRSTGSRPAGGAAGWVETPGSWSLNGQGQWMLLDANGDPYRDTWVVRNGQWYYVNPDGVMLVSWQLLGGKWYYFTAQEGQAQPLGSMLYNTTTPDGYQVGADGAWIQ